MKWNEMKFNLTYQIWILLTKCTLDYSKHHNITSRAYRITWYLIFWINFGFPLGVTLHRSHYPTITIQWQNLMALNIRINRVPNDAFLKGILVQLDCLLPCILHSALPKRLQNCIDHHRIWPEVVFQHVLVQVQRRNPRSPMRESSQHCQVRWAVHHPPVVDHTIESLTSFGPPSTYKVPTIR